MDVDTARPALQRSPAETEAALRRTALIKIDDADVIAPVEGTPPGSPPAWRLSSAARIRLARRTAHLTSPVGRQHMILEWARARGRVSSSEVSSLTGLSVVSAGKILADLESDGRLAAGRPTRTGRGFFYVPIAR